MGKKRTCAQCGKEAIGFQSIGCCFMDVCEEHADSHILALRPGEKQSVGTSFFFERFETDGADRPVKEREPGSAGSCQDCTGLISRVK